MLFYGILNMQQTKYGVDPKHDEMILITNMKHGFERMCKHHEAVEAFLCFIIHAVMYILLYIYIYIYRYTYYTLFLCL